MSWLYRRRRKVAEQEAARARRERTADTTSYADPHVYDAPAVVDYSSPSACDTGGTTSYSDSGSAGGSCDAGGGI